METYIKEISDKAKFVDEDESDVYETYQVNNLSVTWFSKRL